MQKYKCRGLLLTSAIIIGLFFAGTAVSQPAALQQQFQNELKSLHEQYHFPGAAAAFILPDGTVGEAAVGLADSENGTAMTPDARMPAASIGKTFVAAAVLALAGEKRLSLDDPVSKWLDGRAWFERLPNQNHITVRHLLTHTSGIPNHVESEAFARTFQGGGFPIHQPPAPEQLIAFVLDQPPLFDPGKGWHYSDTGYLLIGLVIKEVTGQSFYREVTRRFLAPLHLEFTGPSNHRSIPGLAAGYLDKNNAFGLPEKTTIEPGVMAWHPGIEGAGGGFVSNPKDLVIWAKSLYEGKAMTGGYLDILLDPVPVDDANPDVGYGIGAAIHRNGPFGSSCGHGGWIPGYSSSMRYYPEHRIAVAFQLNTDIGIVDDSTPVIREMETRLANIVIQARK